MTITKWVIDPAHSEIHFKVRHLVISTVTGSFGELEGSLETEGDDLTDGKITFSANTASVKTGNAQRDGHLTSPDFFDSAKHPTLNFTSTSIAKTSDDEYTVVGDLTMHGVTKPVTLHVVHGGVVKDPYGNTKAGYEVTGKLNRSDFGLTFNIALETGGVAISDEVRISANIQLAKS